MVGSCPRHTGQCTARPGQPFSAQEKTARRCRFSPGDTQMFRLGPAELVTTRVLLPYAFCGSLALMAAMAMKRSHAGKAASELLGTVAGCAGAAPPATACRHPANSCAASSALPALSETHS